MVEWWNRLRKLVAGRCNGEMDRGGWKRSALGVGLVLAALGLFVLLYGELPWLLDGTRLRGLGPKDQTGVLGSDRGDVLKMVAGAGALAALFYTARNYALDRAGQVTDRYAKAITQLASGHRSERIGGIFALKRIMRDSPPDHSAVIQALAAFVRQAEAFEADVQAAMAALAERPARKEQLTLDLRGAALAALELPDKARLTGANLSDANLTRAHLVGANLVKANFRGANLTTANLKGANLSGADFFGAGLAGADFTGATLTRANLRDADLAGAILIGADLSGADFTGATLTRAILRDANLTKAHLIGANLTEANFSDANLAEANLSSATLTGAQDLVPAQLAVALMDKNTQLDAGLAGDRQVMARIAACCAGQFGQGTAAPTVEPGA